MEDTTWHDWPQIEFDIEQFDDVQDWAVNRFGMATDEVVLIGRGTYNFHIAVKDPKIVNLVLLKFEGCRLQPNQVNKDLIQEELKKQTDLEIEKLLGELRDKLKDVHIPTFEQIEDAVRRDAYFSYNNGVWTNVKE